MTLLAFRRSDGSFVGVVNGLPYHIIPGDPRWGDAQQMAAMMGDALPLEPPPPPAPPAPPRTIAKTTIYRRASDAELTLLEATLAALPLRQRLLWQDAEGGTVYVHEVEPVFVAAVGAPRAAELLAP